MSAQKKNKFQRFVDRRGGVSQVAKDLDLPVPTVSCWYTRIRKPSAQNLLLLKEFSKGELTFEDILEGTSKET